MYKSNIKKNKRVRILFLITITISFVNFGQFFWNSNQSVTDSNSIDEFDLFNELKTSDYSSSYSGTGENMSLTLHQSYLNDSFDTILNTSIVNGNNFTLTCPTEIYFNSSYTRFEVEDILAPNKTLIVEDSPQDWQYDIERTDPGATSFIAKSDCYIQNISLNLRNSHATDTANVEIVLYNSSLVSLGPGDYLKSLKNITVGPLTFGWVDITGLKEFVDNSKTENDIWFIGLIERTTSFADAWWYYTLDAQYGLNGDGLDETDSYRYNSGSSSWSLISDSNYGPATTVDLGLKLDLIPLNNTPNPEDIGLKINNKPVNGYFNINGSGYWESFDVNSSATGKLNYNVTADWWDIECNISQVQINYTRTDLKARSEFNIAGGGQIVNWNVTRNGGLNYFDSRFNNYQINFTIPDTWDETSIRVFNGAVPKTSDSTNRSLGNGYRDVNVLNAGNGTFWYLTAESTNLLPSITAYTDSGTPSKFNFTNIVHFNATFSTDVNDGLINLSVYSPATINNLLNYSLTNSSFDAGYEIYFGDWNISDTVIKYGIFRIKLGWNNNTDAGFLEDTITVVADTSLKILQPSPNVIFDANKIFNITISYNDTGQNQYISDADIQYKINNGDYSTVNESVEYIGNGQYNITFDCNNTQFNYGSNNITIKAGGPYYNNQTETINFKILGVTNLTSSIPKSSYNSTETFDISLNFTDTVKDLGIDSATIEVYVNQTLYNPTSINDFLNGTYDITINCSDDIFDSQGYGYFNLSIDVEKSYYNNQTTSDIIIYITGETNITATKFPDPIIGYYNSDEMFNITAYFEDIGRNEGINGGLAKIYVKEVSASSYQEYTPVIIDPYGVGYYNITVDCSDPIFNPYGKYNIKINITKSHYYTAEEILEEVVVGNTTLTILAPTGTISYVENEIFDIKIEYEDHTLSSGIVGADITYTIDGTNYRSDKVDNLDGTYNITIDVGDADFGTNYGNVDIIIRANKTNYINLTRTLTFERQITTQITPFNNPPLVEVMRGINVTYTFNYSDTSGNPIVEYDNFQRTSPFIGFQYHLRNDGGGNYTLDIDTSNVGVIVDPYTLNFSISVFGNQSQEISLTILLTIIQTSIEIESWNNNADFARSTWINVSINFYFNDTTNNAAIDGLIDNDIKIKDYYAGTTWQPGFELFNRPGPGNYKLNISTVGKNSGLYTLQLNISKYPNYNWSLSYFSFYLRGNYSQAKLVSVADPGGQLTPEGKYHNFTIFEGSDITIEFNMTDLEYGNTLVLTLADSYTVRYQNLNTAANGIIATRAWEIATLNHRGEITTSNPALVIGNYEINITINKLNYEEVSFVLNLTVIQKYQANLTTITPESVNAGLPFKIIIKAEYYNGSVWLPIDQSYITIIPYYNGIAGQSLGSYLTNSTGEVEFEIPTYSDTRTLNLTIQLTSAYYHQEYSTEISDITIIPSPGLTFEDLLPYLIIIGAAVAAVGGSVAVYRGVVVPKKREKARVLTEVKTIFDDAINLEHVLVLYKGTGTCVFFKSFGSEQIDPELISGFISAICSFGKDLVSQEELNEISYGDKMLLLSDGEYIRVALVLSKKASLILRRNLMEFIHAFERTYTDDLPNWRGQLNIFRGAGSIVDEILSTSIILPHKITYEHSNVKALKNPQSRDVLKIGNNLMKDSERNFFFIATLLKEATEKTGKDTAEIFMGIKELRDNKILIPIELSTIEKKPISQQEMNLINQKVSSLVNLSPEERQKLVNDLAQLGPAEREAYFVSLTEQHEIVSAPIESKPGAAVIETIKEAKKEIKNLNKNALIAKKEKDYDKCMKILQNAAKLALNWELIKESQELDEIMRKTKIEDLSIKMKTFEKEAKLAVKGEKYNEAAQKYKISSKIASEIFKLGVTDMTKEVKRLSNKAKEYEKLV